MTTDNQDTAPGIGHNDPVNKLLTKAHDLGAQKARGVDTLVQFGLMCVEAAYQGHIDLKKSKHGEGMDDAVHLYAAFEKGRSKASIFDHTSASGKVQATKLRSCVKLGGWTRGGTGQPIATVNKLMDIRRKLRNDPLSRSKLDDAYATLLRYARYQIKQNSVVDDVDVLTVFCLKKVSEPIGLQDYLSLTAKRLDDLRSGKAAGGTLRHSSANIVNALSALRGECTAVANNPDEDEED